MYEHVRESRERFLVEHPGLASRVPAAATPVPKPLPADTKSARTLNRTLSSKSSFKCAFSPSASSCESTISRCWPIPEPFAPSTALSVCRPSALLSQSQSVLSPDDGLYPKGLHAKAFQSPLQDFLLNDEASLSGGVISCHHRIRV